MATCHFFLEKLTQCTLFMCIFIQYIMEMCLIYVYKLIYIKIRITRFKIYDISQLWKETNFKVVQIDNNAYVPHFLFK